MQIIKSEHGKRLIVERPNPEVPIQGACTEDEHDLVLRIVADAPLVEGVPVESRRQFVRFAVRALARELGYEVPSIDADDIVIKELPPLPD